MTHIEISYDGKWPALCMGHLIVTIDDKVWDFGEYVLASGGSVWFSDNYADAYVEEGYWDISKWPENFPEELKSKVIDRVNEEITHGCCGGCI